MEEQEHHEHKDEISTELEALLHTDPSQGLTDQEVEERVVQFGRNELKEVKKNPILKFLGYFTGAIAYLIEVACIIAAVVQVMLCPALCPTLFSLRFVSRAWSHKTVSSRPLPTQFFISLQLTS